MTEVDGIDIRSRLEALEQIPVLEARYCRHVDTKNWSEFSSLFTDQAMLSFPENNPVLGSVLGDYIVAYKLKN
jgi:SnoaL-like domain